MRSASLSLGILVISFGCASCSSGGQAQAPQGGGDAGSDAPPIGTDSTVTAFDATPIYFTGTDNKRKVDAQVAFPTEGTFDRITLHLSLSCPSNKCDPWDRFGSLGVTSDPTKDPTIEIYRFVTPYAVGATWDLDVTDLRPLLSGALTLRAYIDTWVGPGSQYGNGWLLTAKFDFHGGVPAKLPIAVLPVFPLGDVAYGDPARPIPMQLPASKLTLPAGATSYALRSFVTGHGQGNAANCAEFCGKTHTFTAGANAHAQKIWRTDCAKTAAPGQQGTYQYSRAGWCPGADVRPWIEDVTADVAGGALSIGYDAEAYENTCRPDATTCAACTLGSTCPYDGGNHTEPHFSVSSLLIAYQ